MESFPCLHTNPYNICHATPVFSWPQEQIPMAYIVMIWHYSVRFIRGRHFQNDITSFAVCNSGLCLSRCPTERNKSSIMPLESEGTWWTEPNLPGQRLGLGRAVTALETADGVVNIEISSMFHQRYFHYTDLSATGSDLRSIWRTATIYIF